MRCSTIITCELLNYTVQRQATQSKSTIEQAQSVADKQDKLARNTKIVTLLDNSVFITIQVV